MNLNRYLFLILSFAISLTLTQCKKTDWSENYKEDKKTPFGTYIIFNESEELFELFESELMDENIYDFLIDRYLSDGKFNYICIKDAAYKINQDGIDELLSRVYDGNNAFISLNYYSRTLEEALEIKVEDLDSMSYAPIHLKGLSGQLSLKNKEFNTIEYHFDRNLRRNFFSFFNPKNTIVLGTQKVNGKEQPNFLKIYHGEGAIYVHTQPTAFSNYNMLKDNHEYAEKVLSYLPSKKTYWDPQIRWSKISSNQSEDSGSILAFFWNNPSLKWALYIGFFGLILFMIFNARRKQRPIPVILPSKNSTVEFTQTISNLYLKNDNHKSLIDKKIRYFLEKTRTRYLIDTNNLNKEFIKKLSLKSGNNFNNTKYLINSILALNKKTECTEEDMMVLSKMIDNFLKQK
tara:strand:+ start:29694 stop:30905 length:1212 start_codon:yes stop_codon:yes gene_type:complete